MADGTARSVDLPGTRPEHRPRLRIVGEAGSGAGRAPPLFAPAVLPPVLSRFSGFLGIGRGGWMGALGLYAALIAALALMGWRATPPDAWPQNAAVFRVVFEAPPQPAPMPPPAPAPPAVAAAPEPAPPPPPETVVTKQLAALPLPPPPKPQPPPAGAAPRPVAPPAMAMPEPSAGPPDVAVPLMTAAPLIPPRPISGLAGNRKPDYPLEARRRGLAGKVVLRVEVSAQGQPLAVSIAQSSGHGVLDRAALVAVEGWRFNPATQAGIAVAGRVEVPIQFRLED